jgi:hypothetical protein
MAIFLGVITVSAIIFDILNSIFKWNTAIIIVVCK